MVISAASLSFMYFLYYYKIKAARILNSKVLEADANCSLGCIHLSVTLFSGSILQIVTSSVFNSTAFWWVDSAVACIISSFIAKEGVAYIQASN